MYGNLTVTVTVKQEQGTHASQSSITNTYFYTYSQGVDIFTKGLDLQRQQRRHHAASSFHARMTFLERHNQAQYIHPPTSTRKYRH